MFNETTGMLSVFLLAFVLTACGGGGGNNNSGGSVPSPTPTPTPPPGVTPTPTPSPTPTPEQFTVEGVEPVNLSQVATNGEIRVIFNAEISSSSIYYNSSNPSLDSVQVTEPATGRIVSIQAFAAGNTLSIRPVDSWNALSNYRVILTSELSSTASVNNLLSGGYSFNFTTDIKTIESDIAYFTFCDGNFLDADYYDLRFLDLNSSVLGTPRITAGETIPVDPLSYPCADTFDGQIVEARSAQIQNLSQYISSGNEFRAQLRVTVYQNRSVILENGTRGFPDTLTSNYGNVVRFRFDPN